MARSGGGETRLFFVPDHRERNSMAASGVCHDSPLISGLAEKRIWLCGFRRGND
jgi:hypothetical protein